MTHAAELGVGSLTPQRVAMDLAHLGASTLKVWWKEAPARSPQSSGCTSQPGRAPAAPWALLLLALPLVRRRR